MRRLRLKLDLWINLDLKFSPLSDTAKFKEKRTFLHFLVFHLKFSPQIQIQIKHGLTFGDF